MSNANEVEAAAWRRIEDRQQITDGLHLYCRALDRCDESLLRSLFHADSVHSHGAYQGSSSDFCRFAMELLHKLEKTQHLLGNIVIELAGETAYSESYFHAHHRIAKGTPGFGPFITHRADVDEDIIIAGRYLDRWQRREGVWKIARRIGVHDWEQWSVADERDLITLPPQGRSRRDLQDPVYLRE
jgi:hypothetical protein